MGIKSDYDKISMSEAQKMIKVRDPFVHLMHIEWFTPQTGFSIIHGIDLRALLRSMMQ